MGQTSGEGLGIATSGVGRTLGAITSVFQVSTVILTTVDGEVTELSTHFAITSTIGSGRDGNDNFQVLTVIIPMVVSTMISGVLTSMLTFVPFTTTLGREETAGSDFGPLTISIPTVISTTMGGVPTEISTWFPFTTTLDQEGSGMSDWEVLTIEAPTVVSTTISGTPIDISTFAPLKTTLGHKQTDGSASGNSGGTTVLSTGERLHPSHTVVLLCACIYLPMWVYYQR